MKSFNSRAGFAAYRGMREGLHFPQCRGPEALARGGSGGARPGSGAATGATMAETDPKSVQDLTAVVRGGRAANGLGRGGGEGESLSWMSFVRGRCRCPRQGVEGDGACIPERSASPTNCPLWWAGPCRPLSWVWSCLGSMGGFCILQLFPLSVSSVMHGFKHHFYV